MARQRLYLSPNAARRVGRIVRDYEAGDRDQSPIEFRTAFDENEPRLGTIATSWTKGSTATVTPIKADGSAIANAVTFTARNWFADVAVPNNTTRKVLCVFYGGQWLLVAAECA